MEKSHFAGLLFGGQVSSYTIICSQLGSTTQCHCDLSHRKHFFLDFRGGPRIMRDSSEDVSFQR